MLLTLLLSGIHLTVLAAPPASQPASGRPLVGAIRWDAWHGSRGVPGRAMERTLAPAIYHDRLPFFARIIGPEQVEIRGDSQEVCDREIAYARQAGLDYWAFVTYEPDDPMSLGLKHFLASQHKRDLRFCLITEQVRWSDPATFKQKVARFVSLMSEPSYLKTPAGRPLFYLGFIDKDWTERTWGGLKEFRRAVDTFRKEAVRAGLGQPYIVIMEFDPQQARQQAEILGADAISAYALCGGTPEGTPFEALMARGRSFWEACRATGSAVVPLVSLGWDPRPRVDNPVPWTVYPNRNHYRPPTPKQVAEHLGEALAWMAANPACTPAQAILIYAWNENDEGGYLVPTFNRNGTSNTERIEAVGRLLRNWQPTDSAPATP